MVLSDSMKVCVLGGPDLLGSHVCDQLSEGIHVRTGIKEYGPTEDVYMILDHLVGAYLMRIIKHG